jgi:hypothetical protein
MADNEKRVGVLLLEINPTRTLRVPDNVVTDVMANTLRFTIEESGDFLTSLGVNVIPAEVIKREIGEDGIETLIIRRYPTSEPKLD